MDASRSALLVASSADPEAADAALCQALVECINECRRLADEVAMDPLLPLADCPRRLLVRSRAVWSPGCDWMEHGYQLITGPQPILTPAAPRRQAPDQRPTATGRARQAVGESHRIRGRPGGRTGDPMATSAFLNPASAADPDQVGAEVPQPACGRPDDTNRNS
jgi:hypothetical protein